MKTNIMTRSDCFKAGRKITPKGIMVHSTATPGVMAAQWFALWNKPGVKACVHAFVDDKDIWQYLPWNHRGWHAGGAANNTHIGFELCEPSGHTYKPGSGVMIGYDTKKNEAYFRAAWNNAVALCAMLCQLYGWDETSILDHSEGYRRGVATNSADVSHWFPKHGESMDTFRATVKKALRAVPTPPPPINEGDKEDRMEQISFNRMFAIAMADFNKSLAAQPPSGWAKEKWDEMCAAGLFDGSGPRSPFTREQAAMVFSRLRD